MTSNNVQIEAIESTNAVDLVESPECFLAISFWLTMAVMGLWLLIHEPSIVPTYALALFSGTYLLSSFIIIKNAFSSNLYWGLASMMVPGAMYLHLAKNIKRLKCETAVNLSSLFVILCACQFLPS